MKDPFIKIKLRKSEAIEIKETFEFFRYQNGKNTDEGRYCTKIINRFNKELEIK